MRRIGRLGLLAALGLVPGGVRGDDGPEPGPGAPRGYVCPRVDRPIAVDGVIDDAGWAGVPWTDEFVDIEGSKKPAPRLGTRAKMAWDDQYLYVAAQLDEPDVWGTIKDHDAIIFFDNDFEVFIDPDGDNHQYYELEINALNTEWDLLLRKPYRDGGPAQNAWEIPGLKKAVKVSGTINDPADVDEGWSVELAIPWADLAELAGRASPPRAGDQWRINFSRVEWDTRVEGGKTVKVPKAPEHNWVWSPQGVIDMHQPERWGYLQFSGKPPGSGEAYRVDPSAEARERLMAIYHAEKRYQKERGAWTNSLEVLGLPPDTPAEIKLTAEGYTATSAEPKSGDHPGRTWAVSQDSRLFVAP